MLFFLDFLKGLPLKTQLDKARDRARRVEYSIINVNTVRMFIAVSNFFFNVKRRTHLGKLGNFIRYWVYKRIVYKRM